ncbi:hypothetical protein OR16_30154 [Cupriavidus basilensis OR16]|uniref:DUF2867 domain-containing protein n=1 Tax=Cupriavidus basilensis OR16 TaxID=1127483 RepID=H1SCS4_9BURK|nr:hypothetical protein [Cupriavidus basilensis]EHP39665.1 hypothetical protein OR16_30154 [Cupriavidus basilensis OR16]
MELINRYLPQYQFEEVHGRHIPASPGRVLDIVTQPHVFDDPVARSLITLREMPNRLAGRLGFPSALKHSPAFGLSNFTNLGRDGDRELAFGLAGRFWRTDFGLVSVPDPEAFATLDPMGIAKLVMNFTAEDVGQGTKLTTRTRVWCRDDAVRQRFNVYWLLIRPASGLIRHRLLSRVYRASDRG